MPNKSKQEHPPCPAVGLPDIDLQQISPIAKKQGIDADQCMVDRILDIATRYRDDLNSEPKVWRDATTSLNELLGHLDAAIASLSRLTPYAASSLTTGYREQVVKDGQGKLGNDAAALSRLARIVRDVLPSLTWNTKGGAPPKCARDSLFFSLASLWEESSGCRFQYPDKRQPRRGSEFIRGLVKLIAPEITDCEINLGLEAVAKASGAGNIDAVSE